MSKSGRLRADDIRTVARLIDDCRDLGDDAGAWATHLAAGLGAAAGGGNVLVGSISTAALQVVTRPPGTPLPAEVPVLTQVRTEQVGWGWENGFDPAGYERLAGEMVARGGGFHPLFETYLAIREKENGVALSRADIVADPAWYRTEYYWDFHEPAGGDAILMCYRAAPHVDGLWAVVLVRPPGERDFSARQKALIAEATAAVVPLVGGPLARFAEPSPSALPPRARAVLRCFLEGDSDKLTATRLGIGRHTVNQYAKLIFRHFGVTTRNELLARWVKRGWGGHFRWADAPAELVGPRE